MTFFYSKQNDMNAEKPVKKKQKKWRKWNRNIHRDFGYFFFGAIIIYAISGIVLNHRDDWNPDLTVVAWEEQIDPVASTKDFTKKEVEAMLDEFGVDNKYYSHFYPKEGQMKVFLKKGSMELDYASGEIQIEVIRRRYLIPALNWMHYNPNSFWTWYSDIFAGALIVLAISGLLILRGKNGIKGRGWWLTLLGLGIPGAFLIMFYF
jgi:hypothetical protein